jgi:DUF438 domain-containing protein
MGLKNKRELVKELLKSIHSGVDPVVLKNKFREVLREVSPFEIPLIEQELIKEGFSVNDILKLCDLHVELFREFLESRELVDVPKGHPLDYLLRENEWILKQTEVLGVYAQALLNARSPSEASSYTESTRLVLRELRKIRLHYRKIQMLIFPYLERRGLIAVPRVLWGREDQVLVKLRNLTELVERATREQGYESIDKVALDLIQLSREIQELVFRENKILYPAIKELFTEGEWAAIAELSDELGYIVEVEERQWTPSVKPIYPYEIQVPIKPDQLDRLPQEFRAVLERGIQPDAYVVRREGDIELPTGFLKPSEVDGILRSLPLEITYADINDRVRFFSESELISGFPRAKTILGRILYYCHPPRLENYVRVNVEAVKKGQFKYREFWTRLGDRIIRVILALVRSRSGELLGVLEVVEDLTDIVNNPEEVKKKIMVL